MTPPRDSCWKRKYPSKRSAKEAIVRRNRGHKRLRPYLCPYCSLWHLTSQKQRNP